MRGFNGAFRRELAAYFQSAQAWVFLAIYLLVTGLATWNVGRFFDVGRADLSSFFVFQPWLMTVFMPAIGMRLWSEDKRTGSIDLYLTSPISPLAVTFGKFSAALCLALIGFAMTFPYWIMISWLGEPDHGVIIAAYLHLVLAASACIAITLVFSALTEHVVIALVASVFACLILMAIGQPAVTGQIGSAFGPMMTGWLQSLSLHQPIIEGFEGVIAWPGVFYLTGLTAVGLFISASIVKLNTFQGMPIEKRLWPIASMGSAMALVLSVHGFAGTSLKSWRQDFTHDQVLSLSKGSADYVSSLSEPIHLDFYYTPSVGQNYPDIRRHAVRIQNLLGEYAARSDGKLVIKTHTPAPFTPSEDRAIASGLTAVPTDGVDPLYLGITGRNLTDDTASIPFLSPERRRYLEYDITRMIASIDILERPMITVLSRAPELNPEYGSRILDQLGESFHIEFLPTGFLTIPDASSALVIAGDVALTPFQAYQIDQFIMRKGRAFILSDPVRWGGERAQNGSPELDKLLTAYGVKQNDTLVADASIGLSTQVDYGARGVEVETHPLLIAPPIASMSRRDLTTADLQRPINFGAAGWVSETTGTSASFSPLITTTDTTSQISSEFGARAASPLDVRSAAVPAGEPLVIAARISGKLATAFDGPITPELPGDPVLRLLAEAEIGEFEHLRSSVQYAEIIIVADTDFLRDEFYIDPSTGQANAANLDFVLNTLEQLAGAPEFGAIRAKSSPLRPMTRIVEMRRAAEAEYLSQEDAVLTRLEVLEADIGRLENRNASPEYLAARQDLRDIQKAFRRNIDRLENWLKFWTLWLPPLLALLTGIGVQWVRGRRA